MVDNIASTSKCTSGAGAWDGVERISRCGGGQVGKRGVVVSAANQCSPQHTQGILAQYSFMTDFSLMWERGVA